jgi:hypothetical protein
LTHRRGGDVDRQSIEATLAASEAGLAPDGPGSLSGTGFWNAVAAVKRNPGLADTYADRMAAIDRTAFERWALFTLPIRLGTTLAIVATLLGFGVITAGYYVDEPWNGLLLLAGTGIVLVPTHGLGHLVVGRLLGMRFTHWFIGTVRMPQPGVKVDYATYLRTQAANRAWMHASGAIVTKVIPFLLIGAAWGMEAPWWAWAALVVIGAVTIATDVLWSTKSSDWKKFHRERRYVR